MIYKLIVMVPALIFAACQANKQLKPEQDTFGADSQGVNIIKPNPDGQMDLSMYPEAKEGQERHIIKLDQLDDEVYKKVEILVGKDMEVDCNNHSLPGEMKEVFIEGWGFSYFDFTTDGQTIGTLRGCPDNTKRTLFVHFAGDLTRYNSRLPLVVYTPKGYEVKYHIWSRGTEAMSPK